MNKMGKKVMALLVVLTSIISFFPAEFIGQAVNAATTTSDPTAIYVYNANATTPITATTDTTTNKAVYSSQMAENEAGKFDVVVNDVRTDDKTLENEANTNVLSGSGMVSGIVGQQVKIMAVNGINCDTDAERATLNTMLGISIGTTPATSGRVSVIGETISGLPYGVNRISYQVTTTTESINYTAAITSGTTTTAATVGAPTTNSITYSTNDVTIYYASNYVTSKITSMLFKAYIGGTTYFDDNDNIDASKYSTIIQNNSKPFLYSTQAQPDSDMPLKYTFKVPDSTDVLKYIMTFDQSFTGATIFKNGIEANENSDFTITQNYDSYGNVKSSNLSGNLGKPGSSDLIVIKLSSSATQVEKTYSIEISYTYPNATDDYSLKTAGITKYNYDSDNTVNAYIGKKFDVTTDATNGFQIYTGNIYIDKKATMISIDPTLVRNANSDNVAFVVTNNYYDPTLKKTISKSSELKNGKQFINFMASTTSNQLQVDVYSGSNGNQTSSSTLLARYLLNVTLLSSDNFSMGMAFGNSDGSSGGVYLTQPGVSQNTINFSTSRLTYDLYSSDIVKVLFTGVRSNKNEYLRVWLASSLNGNNFKEAQGSIDNTSRSTSFDVNVQSDANLGAKAKKMLVQAYYDVTTGGAVTASYPVGDQYVFDLPNNYDSSDTSSDTGNTSGNALLNNLQVTNATLKDSGGNTTFSSSVYNYTTTVDKSSTTATITATTQDDNVQSIAATVQETGTSYDLTSGEASDITLSTTGTTTVKIVVTAQDGTTTKAYTVVISNNTKSSTATLKNVILNAGDYTFDPTADTTKVHESQNATSVTVTPVPTDASSTVTVNGQTYSSSPITVSIRGSQTTDIEIVVTSQDGTASKTYTLEVYRTDSTDTNTSNSSNSSTQDDQYYDQYNDCWVDTTKYDEWGTVNGNPVYFDKHNRQVKNAWISTGGKYYFLNNSGYRASGWKVDDADGKAYYLDPTTGEMKTGWINLSNSWYYLGLNGVMHKGWLYLNGKWYYFTPNGQMVINQSMFVEDKVYNFGQDGAVI